VVANVLTEAALVPVFVAGVERGGAAHVRLITGGDGLVGSRNSDRGRYLAVEADEAAVVEVAAEMKAPGTGEYEFGPATD
jgi:hypothetical protein